jgi:hypothetical protein
MRVRVRLACTRWGDTVMTHRTIALLLTLAFGLFVAALATNAQPLPTVHRIGLLRTGTALAEQPFLESIRQGLHDLGYVEGQNLVLEVRYAAGNEERLRELAAELDSAFAAMTRAGAEALVVIEDALLISPLRGRIIDLAVKHRLPAMCDWRPSVAAGCLMAYGPSQPDTYRRMATYVDKILKGTKPADVPVEQPTKFEFVVNLKTAEALGLTIPPALLFQATDVIR